ncbi:multicopper oxidase domain-containing protein [Kocuria sp. M1R5S2]|uniref:multicopper oxidase domain-containing protein n=1 Tax=Kocuria rhizosphaerae TaxID=3376285 RepID=UPI0037BA236E
MSTSRDVGRLPVPEEITEVVIAPGNRIELLVETTERSSTLVAAPVDRGGMDGMMGRSMAGDGPMTGCAGSGEGAMMDFAVNAREFDPDRTDFPAAAGTVEEWTLRNSSPTDHPVHLHVWPAQIVEDGDRDVSRSRWQDVVSVPAVGHVEVLITVEDFPGRTVYH